MSDDYGDEVRAFRQGLRQVAADADFDALDPVALRAAGRGRVVAWPAVVAVAAVVALGGGLVGVQLWAGGMGAAAPASRPEAAAAPVSADESVSADETASGGSAGPGESEGAGVGGEPADFAPPAIPQARPSEATANLGEPDPGFRWVHYGPVAVQVPDGWGSGTAPTGDWCVRQDWPTMPYVSIQSDSEVAAAGVCRDTIPADRLVWHVRVSSTSSVPLIELPSPWRYQSVVVDGVQVAVASDGSDPELVERILGSARRVP